MYRIELDRSVMRREVVSKHQSRLIDYCEAVVFDRIEEADGIVTALVSDLHRDVTYKIISLKGD